MNYSANKAWDRELRKLMYVYNPTFVNLYTPTVYTIKFTSKAGNEKEVWISNYPYAYGTLYSMVHITPLIHSPHPRPSRLTILKLRKLEKDLKEGKKRKNSLYILNRKELIL